MPVRQNRRSTWVGRLVTKKASDLISLSPLLSMIPMLWVPCGETVTKVVKPPILLFYLSLSECLFFFDCPFRWTMSHH